MFRMLALLLFVCAASAQTPVKVKTARSTVAKVSCVRLTRRWSSSWARWRTTW